MSMTKIVAVTENLKTKVQDLLMQTDRLRAIYADEKLMMEQSGLTQEQLDTLAKIPEMDKKILTRKYAKELLTQFEGNDAYPMYVLGKAFLKMVDLNDFFILNALSPAGMYLRKSQKKESRLCTLDLLIQVNREYYKIGHSESDLKITNGYIPDFNSRFSKISSHS